ncbi:GNAT family N-acetyltransferase [Actinoplanes sp. KI2]|uniref:GNAT family N-acetyltransferase n=1 Tax=Actinoplanes sp. KI2 TaxID=2983315 RepID=UPI0021D5E610|nr:GNAT family protein [Actinoplanes sp. KI2]MCU7729159.1 GNAT family N-acetyltransferase [Actinoplanes sp. KI2]
MAEPSVALRPVTEDDLPLLRRFLTEPGLIGLDWAGFRDAGKISRRFATDGFLDADDTWLMVSVDDDGTAAGFVSYRKGQFGAAGPHYEIGIALLPEWRGRGIGWRAQAMLCDYLFAHTPVQRIQAGTHPENLAEQRSLVKAGFTLEGVIRACEFRAGRWRDGYLYSRLRDDPSPG